MSTLNEIAANHARLAKAKEEESIRLSELHGQIVGGFEMPAIEARQDLSLHFNFIGLVDVMGGSHPALGQEL